MSIEAKAMEELAAILDAMASSAPQAESLLETLAARAFPEALRDLRHLTWGGSREGNEEPDGGARRRSSSTALSDMDAKLRASELRFRTLVEQIPAVTFLAALGEGNNEIYVSPHIEAMLGFTQAEWLADPLLWYRQLHPDDRSRWNEEFTRGCQSGGPFREECRFYARDGSVVWVRGEARIVKDERGRPLFLQGVAFDITDGKRAHELLEQRIAERTAALETANEALVREVAERRRTEEALRSSDVKLRHARKMEAVGRLAGGVAHDFNNMLSVVLSYAEMLLEGVAEGSATHEGLKHIENAAARAASLTQQLLAFSRQQVLQPKVVALNEIVAGIVKMLVRLVGEHITLVTALDPALDPALGPIYVDPAQIEQIIVNLVVNARDAMPRGGRIVVSTANLGDGEGARVRLTVEDDGVGMDAATLERIFEPFFTTKDVGKGTGLGLATVFGIVQQSGGRIDVESNPGVGTRFDVSFQRMAVDRKDREGAHDVALPGGTETILVVEDEAEVRDLVVTILRRAGYSVLSASNGREALALCEGASPSIDLLITDVLMPHMDGRELAERVAASHPGLRILLMSGYPNEVLDPNEPSGRGTSFLPKPVRPKILARKVRAVLDEERPGSGRPPRG